MLLLSHSRMATSVPSPVQAVPPPRAAPAVAQAGKAAAAVASAAAPAALVPMPVRPEGIAHRIPENSPALQMKVELEVSAPVGDFRVRTLLALEPGVVIESRWNHSVDLPLAAGRVQLAWMEFEVVDTQLAARLTRLA
jgi:hypothetical protein